MKNNLVYYQDNLQIHWLKEQTIELTQKVRLFKQAGNLLNQNLKLSHEMKLPSDGKE